MTVNNLRSQNYVGFLDNILKLEKGFLNNAKKMVKLKAYKMHEWGCP